MKTETFIRGKKICINCRKKWATPGSDYCWSCQRKMWRERIYNLSLAFAEYKKRMVENENV